MSDPGKYRSKEELEERKKKDPVRIARQRLLSEGMTEDELQTLEDEVEEEIRQAVRFADESAPAREEVMWETVYAPASGEEAAGTSLPNAERPDGGGAAEAVQSETEEG